MVDREKDPYGYIYRATNVVNGKVYIGQTVASRWNEDKIPIEERWKEEVGEAYRKEARGDNLRYVENAIVKYGPDNFDLTQQDIAHNQEELDRKETEHIRDYDSMNPDEGYNLKEGGLGGRLSDQAKENLSDAITAKYQNDPEYYNKQLGERQGRAKNNPEWIQKMTEINRERAKDPQFKEKLSQAGTKKWQESEYRGKQNQERKERGKNPEFIKKMTEINRERANNPEWREKMSQVGTKKWQESEYREKQNKERRERAKDPQFLEKMREIGKQYRKEIPDKREFLQEIKENVPKKELLQKHDMGGNALNRRVQEMFGPDGPKNYTELKQYLQDRNVNDVLKDIEERTKEKEGKKETKTEETKVKGESKPQEIVKEKSDVEPKKDEKEGKVEPTKEDNKEINPEKEAEVSDKEKELEDKEGNKGAESKNEEKITEEPKQEEKDYAGIDEGISGENSPEKKGDIDGAFESSIIRGNDFINIIDPKTKERGSKEIIGKDTRFTSGVNVIGKKFVNPPKPMGREDKHSDFSGLNINLNIDWEHADMSISGGGGGGGGSEGDGEGGYSLDYGTIDDDDKEEFTTTEQEGEGSSEGRGRSWEV